ncbi:tudor domain-containing protein 7A-like [Phymastichus coffea]|uniref:tudor domain-containing protein 7A-like n=1 Tax=Phymastichus coffea TaxID=108790 RepID=UPI00273CAEEA|nr:tudor domain-containing protein 7A-like [Phymastichus coffea]XP_058793773.1 tudor domain-containing protein 7A-like [Phymastichus coffea]XP_058793774.1 tudor domain-containing protein 7A-like [Phymastichus coffea]
MAQEEDWDMWVSIIRSCCLTSKKPLTLYEIARDVKQLEDKDIPYKTFKFRSLEDMIKNIPSLKVFNQGGSLVVQANISEESAHISKMVQRQKTSKKKSRTLAPRAANRYNANTRRPIRPSYNKWNSQNNYVPNRPNGQYSSPQNQSSYNNRSQQQNGEQCKRTITSPATMQQTTSCQVSSPPIPKGVSYASMSPSTPQPKTATTAPSFSITSVQQRIAQTKTETPVRHSISQPTQQQRLSPTAVSQTPQIKSPQINFTPSPVNTAQKSKLQQRLTTSTLSPSSSNIQERLNIQKHDTTVQPMHDPRLILSSYVKARKLPLPIYKDIPSKDKNIYSSVTVNSKKYSSYPREAKTKEDAEKFAAQAALAELLDKSNIPQTETSNHSLIMQRILDIVHAHPNGLFESSLVANYVAKYNERLPSTWLKLVEHTINIDIGANNLTILSPQQDSVTRQSRPTSPTITELPTVSLCNLDEFYIKIYVVYSTTDIWGVIIHEENSDKIDDLAKDMKHFYDINEAIPATVIPGQYYAVYDFAWHRVRCVKVDTDAKVAEVFFIDRGDHDNFKLSQLRDLSVQFCKLPAQAIQISLVGLEPFSKCIEMQVLLEETMLEENVNVYVKVDSIRQAGFPLPVTCYFELDKDTVVDINEEMITKFMSEVANPQIYMKSNMPVSDVYISEIRNKQVYIQVKSTGLELLNDMITDLAKTCLDIKPVKPAERLEKFKLYLVKHNDKWRRIKLVKEFPDKAQVVCVDEGTIIDVPKDSSVSIEDVSPVLAMFPYQAIQIHLHKISPLMFDEKMAAHLRFLAPKDDVFIMKVVGDLELIPRVELYKRTENNYLASLNDTLALEPEISSKIDDNNNDKTKSRSRKDRKSLNNRNEFPLKIPEIPPINQYFDVIITMAAHPSNFTVQPLHSVNELKKLMLDLSAVCNAYNGPPLTSSNVKVGSMYAARYDNDGKWYRAYLSKILGKTICAVYFCDYGDYRAVSLEHLQPLANQFYDLPYQAIKAKLHGIIPKLKGDWTVKDSLRFNELVVDKSFVSIVKKCEVENTVAGETVLSLELIDTSTDDDVDIIQQLIKEKRAEKIED